MDDSVAFALSTAPDQEPVGLNPPFLAITAHLDGIGLNMLLIKQHRIESVEQDVPFDLAIETDNVKVTLGFNLRLGLGLRAERSKIELRHLYASEPR